MTKGRLLIVSLLPVAVLIVVVTELSRWMGGVVAVVTPPIVAIGVAVLLGSVIKRKARNDE